MPRLTWRKLLPLGEALAVSAAVVTAALFMWSYALTPGAPADAPPRWPAGTALGACEQRTLLLYAHPRCPCTVASVEEFAEVGHQAPQTRVVVAFYLPLDADAAWREGELWELARRRMPTAELVQDPGGGLRDAFGVKTSGQVLLYAADGRLLFQGGVTGARGHAGDNSARARLARHLNPAGGGAPQAPVFGCPVEEEGVCPRDPE